MDIGSETKAAIDKEDPNSRSTLSAILALVVAGGLISIVAYSPTLEYYQSKESSFVGALGILLAYYGLLLSIGGFGLTWWQLSRTQSAAYAAKEAIRRLKQEFASFDVLLELRTAKVNADECRRLLAGGAWNEALQSYYRIRASLLEMGAINFGVGDPASSKLKDYAAGATGAIVDLEAKGRDPTLTIDAGALSTTLLEMDEFFVELEHQVRDNISGS